MRPVFSHLDPQANAWSIILCQFRQPAQNSCANCGLQRPFQYCENKVSVVVVVIYYMAFMEIFLAGCHGQSSQSPCRIWFISPTQRASHTIKLYEHFAGSLVQNSNPWDMAGENTCFIYNNQDHFENPLPPNTCRQSFCYLIKNTTFNMQLYLTSRILL